jgi:hypothetical protein
MPAERLPSGGHQTSLANCPRWVGFTARDQSEWLPALRRNAQPHIKVSLDATDLARFEPRTIA